MRARFGGLLALHLFMVAASWLWSLPARADAPEALVLTIATAQALLEPEGLPPTQTEVDLARRWDIDFPGRDGRATYRIALPARAGPEPMAVFFSRVGNQVVVQVNGSTVQRWGVLGEPRFDAGKVPVMVVVPAALLHTDRANELRVDVTIQSQRWGGLSVLRYGPLSAIEPLYAEQWRWRHSVLVVFAAGLAGMGGIAGLLWWRQRDPLYGVFTLAAFLGVVRHVDRTWPDVPLPWPLLGALAAVSYACHLALICRFAQMALGPLSPRMARGFDATIVAAAGLAVLSFTLRIGLLWTLGLAALVPFGVASVVVIANAAWRRGGGRAWTLTAVGLLALLASVYDLTLIRLGHSSGLRHSLTPYAIFAFVLVMAAIVAERYSRSVADYRALNANLSQRIADREQQLNAAFDSLREQQHHQSVSAERQRIMREIHDGVGSQLVGLLNMVTQPGADPAALQEQVQLALDEMRMAVDSLQPVHDDLVTVLATLRYRLQPRLQAAGVEVVWDMAELPALPMLSPNAVLQVQRILLEAFTNVLKHARATQVSVRVRWHADEGKVLLEIADNGVGLRGDDPAGEAQRHGHGITNMRSRAAAIGAALRVEPRADRGVGVGVVLEWPVPMDAR